MKINIVKTNFIEKIFILLFLILIFSETLTSITGNSIFLMTDDLIVVVLFLNYIYNLVFRKKTNKLNKNEKRIIYIFLIILLIGVLGNIIYGHQKNCFAIISDAFGWIKFFGIFIFLLKIIKEDNKYYLISVHIAKLITIFGVFFEILNLLNFVNLTPGYDRFGIHSFSFFTHPSATASLFATIVCIFLYRRQQNKVFLIMALILETLTFRFKAIGFVIMVLFLFIFMKKKISYFKVLCLTIIVVLISWNQITFYFLNSEASRAVALNTSFQIANEYFPLGSGFASFGTAASGKYYSTIYYKYNLNNRWGFMENNYSYIGDGGWATIIGQFGWLGFLLFIILIILLWKIISNKVSDIDKKEIIPFLSLIGYILIASTNENFFGSAYSELSALILVILLTDKTSNKIMIK